MRKKPVALLLIFSICLNIGFIVVSGIGYYKHRNEHRILPRLKKLSTSVIFDTVDLKPNQKEEIERLGDLFNSNMLSVSKETSPAKVKIMKTLAKPLPVDEVEIKRLLEQLTKLKLDKEVIVFEHFQSLRKVLTDEQADKVFTRFAEIQKKWADRIRYPDSKRRHQ